MLRNQVLSEASKLILNASLKYSSMQISLNCFVSALEWKFLKFLLSGFEVLAQLTERKNKSLIR